MLSGLARFSASDFVKTRFPSAAGISVSAVAAAAKQGYSYSNPEVAFQASH